MNSDKMLGRDATATHGFATRSPPETRRNGIAAIMAFCLAAIGTPAAAKTYTGTRTVVTNSLFGPGTDTINLSVTTDGRFGTLTATNIIDWTVAVTATRDGRDDYTYTPVNSRIQLSGDALAASDTELTFDFGSTPDDLFEFYRYPDPNDGFQYFYCFQTGGACVRDVAASSGEAVYTAANQQSYSANARTGLVTLATAPASTGAVPEPATWALMIVGFGAAGIAVRRRPRSQPALT